MTWIDVLTMIVASLAALECVAGRLAAMHWAEHRHGLLLGYLAAAILCILTASLTWQRVDLRWLDLPVWAVAAYLGWTWRDWRHGAPPQAARDGPQLQEHAHAVPSWLSKGKW